MKDWKRDIDDAKTRMVIKNKLWQNFPNELVHNTVLAISPSIYVSEELFRDVQESNNTFLNMLLLHELTHIHRQDEMGVGRWWRKYLLSSRFRLSEELVAADTEFEFLATRNVTDLEVENYISLRSADLASVLYFHAIGPAEARDVLTRKWQRLQPPRE